MKKILPAVFAFISFMAHAQKEIPLYDGPIPGSKPCGLKESEPSPARIQAVTKPTITIFLPEKVDSLKAAVLIFPGGGYSRLAMDHEGTAVAQAFNKRGVAAFVVKYRLPNDSCMVAKENGPLQDAQQAIKLVKERALEYNIDAAKVGIIGFSAGGHLAASLATKYSLPLAENKKQTDLRPAFVILGYPVISLSDSLGHTGSRTNLLGKNPSAELVKAWSNELLVTPQTPPTFLVHAADDKTVNVQNSIVFYQALLRNKVGAEMRLFQRGGHGFGMNNGTTNEKWLEEALYWMQSNKWIK